MKRIASLFNTIRCNRRHKPLLPRFLTYLVTFSCNARCVMCDSWRKSSCHDLTLPEIAGIFNQLPRMDVVRLTGGEPFLREDLLDIAHMAQTKLQPTVLHITTNGFLTDRIVKFCEQRKKEVPLHLLISIDGVGGKHNQIRGRSNAWANVTKTLYAISFLQKKYRLKLMVNQTIVDRESLDHYKRLRDFLKPFGLRNNIVLAYDVSATYHNHPDAYIAHDQIGGFSTFGELPRDETKLLLDEVESELTHYPLPERMAKKYYLKGIRNRLISKINHPNPSCVALNSHMRLLPNGAVPTCQFNSTIVGNLRHQSFKDIWHSPEIEKQRRWVSSCAGCWAECEILPNALYTGDLVKETLFSRPTFLKSRPLSGKSPHPAQDIH